MLAADGSMAYVRLITEDIWRHGLANSAMLFQITACRRNDSGFDLTTNMSFEVYIILLRALLLSVSIVQGLSSPLTLAQSPVPSVENGQAVAVAQMVHGLLSFAHWPDPRDGIGLCVVGQTDFGARLNDMAKASDPPIAVRWLGASDGTDSRLGCDALYLGRLEAAAQSRWISWAHGRPVVTIIERDADCQGGAMFCLGVNPTNLSFVVNLDAISRGTVRIDPRILLLSRRGSGQVR